MYEHMDLIYCPGAALRRGCPGVSRGVEAIRRLAELQPLDDDDRLATALTACGACAAEAEVDEDGTVCVLPDGYDSAVVKRDLERLEGGCRD